MEKKIINKPNIQVSYESDRKILEQAWIGFTNSEEFRNAIDASLEFAQLNQVRLLLSNALDHKPIKPDDGEYAASTLPLFKEAGVEKLVFVVPKSAITKLGVRRFTSLNDTEIDIAHFQSMDDARVWISQVL